MRALLMLSAASMALAVAPSVGASPNTSNQMPQTSNSNNNSRYQDKDEDKDKDKDEDKDEDEDKITICHATSSSTNPYVEITVSTNANYQGHGNHSGDIIPAPADGCPKHGYNPDDIKAKAWKVGDDVKFYFKGCPKGKKLGVTIDGETVEGSPFRVRRGGYVWAKVPIPAGAQGDTIEFTCPKPYIVWEIDIQQTRHVYSFGSPVALTPLAASNPAQVASLGSLSGSITAPGSIDAPSSSGTTIPAQQLGFGLASAFGLAAFGGLRHRTRTL